MKIIHSAQARHISKISSFDQEHEDRKAIMESIDRDMNLGQEYTTIYHHIGRQITSETMDWLVELGYLVWTQKPYNIARNKDPKWDQYTYTIYWDFPKDSKFKFRPGIAKSTDDLEPIADV